MCPSAPSRVAVTVAAIEDKFLAAMGERRGAAAADQLCESCVTLLGIDAAAISLVFDGANHGTVGASGVSARRYDEVQFTLGEGPCLDAVAHRAPVVVADLADPAEARWPAYGPAMLGYEIRGVYAMPVVAAGEYVGALDFFQADPTVLDSKQVAGVVLAAELAQIPMLDLLHEDLHDAAATPGSDAWTELNTLTRAEVSQATGMLIAQLNIAAPAALVRLRAHAYATNRSATDVARDIIDRRLRLEPD